MEFATPRFDVFWRLDIFDVDMMSWNNSIFNAVLRYF